MVEVPITLNIDQALERLERLNEAVKEVERSCIHASLAIGRLAEQTVRIERRNDHEGAATYTPPSGVNWTWAK